MAPASVACADVRMSSLNDVSTSRRAILAGAVGATVSATPAWAGYVYSLGIETTKPKDADVDDEILGTKAVQDGLKNIRTYRAAAASLKEEFDKDNNMALIPAIRKNFDFSALRNDLNLVGSVFDDATQETIDRLARGIL
jgi:hypothetical protein